MSHDSRHMRDPSNRFAEQLSDLDAGLRIKQPKVDWSSVVAKRRARRQLTKSIAASVVVLSFVLPAVWYANRPGIQPIGGKPTGGQGELARNEEAVRAAARSEVLAMDRELSQINRQIASLQRKERSRKANMKAEAILKANPPSKATFSDPIEEGALVMLAAAEKTAKKEGKEAGQALYRRVVEIFPDSRSAEIARRELM